MKAIKVGSGRPACVALVLLTLVVTCTAWAQKVKDANQNLDNLAFSRPMLRLSETLSDSETLADRLENISDMDRFRSEYGTEWRFLIDERTGRLNLLEGGAIPFIPGPANDLRWENFAEASCQSQWCIPLPKIEGLARDFLAKHQGIFKVPQDELVLDPAGSIPVGNSLYYLRFQWVYGGVPVEGASIYFAINNGNLIQVGVLRMGDIKLDPVPTVSLDTAWQILDGYLGGLEKSDEIVNPGTLVIKPITPRGMDADAFNSPFGQMIDYVLVYKIAFRRPGVIGTWEALVDAHTGEIIRFLDSNVYGHIQGGVYKTDAPQTEVTAPFPYADYDYYNGKFADSVGNFPGTTGTCTMYGQTSGSTGVSGGVMIWDNCGSISLAANIFGGINFGSSSGTDCITPGVGGDGNTHAARTQYWNVTQIKMKAIAYLPTNTWLQSQLTDWVNKGIKCNAYWDGSILNFFRLSDKCANTGEIPGAAFHEWGHGMDSNDGSCTGCGGNLPVEARADWTALLQTHQSCFASGIFTTGYPCSGYGNACTSCTGWREADYAMHTTGWPWSPQNLDSVWNTAHCVTSCTNCYYGPCGYEDHCESGIATQALWDFVNRYLTGAPTNMDIASAWQLADRLFFTSMPQAVSMYTCTRANPPANTTSSGCGAGTIYTTYRAADDDGDGVANGTPHAAAIFAALYLHNIACGASTDANNQNETTCPSLTKPTLTGAVNNGQNVLTWTTGGSSTTRYFVFRNETGCGAGFTRIATVTSAYLTYTDTACYDGVTYYYRVQAATAKNQCVSPVSDCVTLTTEPCVTPGTPTNVIVATSGNNRLIVRWSSGSPAGASYNIYRSISACPGSAYTRVMTGQPSLTWTDTTVSGGTTYSYEVTAVDSTGLCESLKSGCASKTATGSCTLLPTFAGITSVTNPDSATCALDLSWSAGTSNCSGTLSYRIYRSTTYPFTPGAGNRIASGLTGTTYVDNGPLTNGTTCYYILRVYDSGCGSEDTNTVTQSGMPTGAVYTPTNLLTEDWESATAPALPAGWATAQISGTDGVWATASGAGTHSGVNEVYFNSASLDSSHSARLYRTSGVNFPSNWAASATFWMHHDPYWSPCDDTVQVQYSVDGTNWNNAGPPVHRFDGSTGWKSHTVDLEAATGNASVQLAFVGTSDAGNDCGEGKEQCYLDDVTLSVTPRSTCAMYPLRVPYSVMPVKITTGNHGTDGTVTFNVADCASTNYHILYGKGENLAAWTVDGAKCSVGGFFGNYGWTGIPNPSAYTSRFLWFLVVGDNGGTTEGSWGLTSAGAEEGGANPSNQCSCSDKNTSASCGITP